MTEAAEATLVFLGPSLPRSQAAAILPATFLPPARKGDIYRVLTSGVRRILLLDGVFHNTPSVWQRELLTAIDEGIEVIGATSMGALRAAELYPYGMLGLGVIFSWYRGGLIDGDDEVALRHADAENDFRPLSEPLVNIRFTLERAARDGLLSPEQRDALVAEAKRLAYGDRSYARLLESPRFESWGETIRDRLRTYLVHHRINLKREDAIAALRYCAERAIDRPAARTAGETGSPRSLWHAQRYQRAGFHGGWGEADGAAVLGRLGTREREDRQRAANARAFILEWARQNGVSCPEAESQAYADRWRTGHGFAAGSAEENRFLRANGLTAADCRRLLEERALAELCLRQGPAHFGLPGGTATRLLNDLQIEGRAETLLGGPPTEEGR